MDDQPRSPPDQVTAPTTTAAEANSKPPTQGQILMEIALEVVQLWHTPEKTAWATIGHENYPVLSDQFADALAELFNRRTGKVANGGRIKEVARALSMRALRDGRKFPVHIRVARTGNELWIDMADGTGRAICVGETGWVVVGPREVPVKFYRPENMLPLPIPAQTGDVSDLAGLLNLHDLDELRLLLTFMSFTFVDNVPYPVLVVTGPQGSAKSSFTRIVRAILDPNAVPLLGPPKGGDIVAYARNNWVLCFDNLSGVKPDLADDLCRLATGGGFGGRRLYTNDGVATFNAKRPVILNGIPNLTTCPDLADRALIIRLDEITPDRRQSEEAVNRRLNDGLPRILTVLLNMAVTALQHIPEITQGSVPLPRMADFARWGMAAAPALCWTPEEFLRAYARCQAGAVQDVLDDDPVASVLLAFLEKQPKMRWSGTADELLGALRDFAPAAVQSREFPHSPSLLGQQLRRLEPVLAAHGIVVTRERKRLSRRITIEVVDPKSTGRVTA